MSCPICGEYLNDFDRKPKYVKELDLTVCEHCLERVEQRHKTDGKYVVHRCKECKHVRKVEFIKYRKRGRPLGSKNTPKAPDGTRTLGEYED